MQWTPHVTVASILKQNDKYLFVQERKDKRLVLNQPAGHWEQGETLIEAAIRETLEETCWHFEPQAITGIYQWHHQRRDETFLRFCFSGTMLDHDSTRTLDSDIESIIWLTEDELSAQQDLHRSPLVQRCMDDYLSGIQHDLRIISSL